MTTPSPTSQEALDVAERLLPECSDGLSCRDDLHSAYCPMHYRSAVGQVIQGYMDRVAQLEGAISWALGEGDSDFGDHIPPQPPIGKRAVPYWWRKILRQKAAITPSPESKTS
jgi:hypothetical protein